MGDLRGKLIQILPTETGTGSKGDWKKGQFVIETINAEYPKKVHFQMWNDELANCKVGDTLKVHYDLSSREYNGKWYSDIKAWKVENESGKTETKPPEPTLPEKDLPF